ncbi:hypothetical protein VIGAN_02015100 [Vigna angularis var. angularis]|uniref:Uncharacterized protein n=1 Tax=Vigna angularis var. angularis TaxID=157739 RepID=A0A0S3RB07_PHAAN|nr:hypothetical protein VIGAN_02015100 [Vigna angularis var. angularis]
MDSSAEDSLIEETYEEAEGRQRRQITRRVQVELISLARDILITLTAQQQHEFYDRKKYSAVATLTEIPQITQLQQTKIK